MNLKVYQPDDFPSYLPKLNALYDDLFSHGKGFRAKLIQKISHHLGLPQETVHLLAQTIEFIHNASLLHDDLIDRSPLRREKTAAWLKYTPEYAVLAGDYLLARVMVNLSRHGNLALIQYTSEMISDLLEGEWIQDSLIEDWGVSLLQLDRVHDLKTASLFKWCIRAPFIAAQRDSKDMHDRLDEMGSLLGLLFQRSDDLLDFDIRNTEGKAILGDLQSGYMNSFATFLARDMAEAQKTRFRECKTLSEIYEVTGEETFFDTLRQFDEQNKKLIDLFDRHCDELMGLLPVNEHGLIDDLRKLPNLLYWRETAKEKRSVVQPMKNVEGHRPALWFVMARLMRLDLIAFTLMPALAVFSVRIRALASAPTNVNLNPIFGFTLLALFFFHAAIFCRNDYVDNLNGIDRVNEKGGSRVIQNGWLRARTVYRLYWSFLAIAFFFAAPAIFSTPQLVWLAVVGGGTGLLGYSILRQGRLNSFMPRNLEWLPGDLAVFLSMGPLLTVGANILAREPLTTLQSVLLGAGFGLAAVAYLEVRHLISLVVDDTSGLRTLAVTLGFDNAKSVVATLVVASASCLWVLLWSLHDRRGISVASAFLILAIAFVVRVLRAKSPLASVLRNSLKESILLHLLYGVVFVGVVLI